MLLFNRGYLLCFNQPPFNPELGLPHQHLVKSLPVVKLGQQLDYVPCPVPGSHEAEPGIFHDVHRFLQLFLGLRSPQQMLLRITLL